jgi:hypothetical protein
LRQVNTGFCFIQGSVQTGLYRILFYSGFGSDRFIKDSVLFRVWLRQVYTGLCFIQSSVQTGLYRIVFYSGFGSDRFIQDLFYSGFGSDRFIQDSVLFRVWLRQVYTGFCFIQSSVQTGLYRICFIQGSVKTGLYRILFYSGFGSDRFIQYSVLFRVR